MSSGYVMGIDIGVASIGWSVVEPGSEERPGRIVRLGTHLFEPGVDGTQTAIEQGKDEPKGAARRGARQVRRQLWRRAHRKRKLLFALMKHGIMPHATVPDGAAIDAYIKALDSRLRAAWCRAGDHQAHQIMPYLIRSAGVQRKITLEEFGRALYHLAQRRGFLSNRKAKKKKDEDTSQVKAEINELQSLIDRHVPATLGAYLASLNPDEQRLRDRWTARSMYLHEFEALWTEQSRHHRELTDEAKAAIHRAIFHQRPLKSQAHLIGRCSLEPGRKRAPLAHREFQYYRVLQGVNHLTIAPPGEAARKLDAAQRKVLTDALLAQGDLTIAKVRTLLKLPKGTDIAGERGEEEKKIVGHRTDAKLRDAIGPRFDAMSDRERDQLVLDLRSFRETEPLIGRLKSHWGLSDEQARKVADADLEEGYASYSLAAIRRLIPHLERGLSVSEARKAEYPESFRATQVHDLLPPVTDVMGDLRNPSVMRALTEARKVVNAIIRRYGKPEKIHVELARDLKHGRDRRAAITKQIRQREKQHADAKHRILAEIKGYEPTRIDREKVLLADECDWRCPYTGKKFGMKELIGEHPQVDVEHIWPFSRSFDNSFMNKTLCWHDENRRVKRGRTPYEAYSASPERYQEILGRVLAFKSDRRTVSEKFRRFTAEAIDEDFTNRHLSDTRYIARAVSEYLGVLYGGRTDADGKQRIVACSGGLTSWLRREWGLDALLSPTGDDAEAEKNRIDHRHHAVDALVVALTTPRTQAMLQAAAARQEQEGRFRLFGRIEPLWSAFPREAKAAVEAIVVSHRQQRAVSGKLHAESNYSKPIHGGHRIRKELHKLTRNEVSRIVDPRCRALVEAQLEKLGVDDPAKAFSLRENCPVIKGRDGVERRLRRVRLFSTASPTIVGQNARIRYVEPDSNHHCIVWAKRTKEGEEGPWEFEPVRLLDAYDRVCRGLPVVNRDGGSDRIFKFSVSINEFIEMDDPDSGGRQLYRIKKTSLREIGVQLHHDARTVDEVRKAGDLNKYRISPSALKSRNARKVFVNHLGEVSGAGG